MKILASLIKRKLERQIGVLGHCAIYEDQMQRLWPLNIDYAQNRACFRSGQIRVLDSSGKLERTIAFSEADRKL